jgi:hypothetical protein
MMSETPERLEETQKDTEKATERIGVVNPFTLGEKFLSFTAEEANRSGH